MGVSLLTHIFFNIIILILSFVVYNFVRERYHTNRLVKHLFTLLLAGGCCSLLDKVAWGGSLDYILLQGFFIFDLKDVYISIFELMLVLGVIFNYKSLRTINDKEIMNEFKSYINVTYLKR